MGTNNKLFFQHPLLIRVVIRRPWVEYLTPSQRRMLTPLPMDATLCVSIIEMIHQILDFVLLKEPCRWCVLKVVSASVSCKPGFVLEVEFEISIEN